MKNIIFWASASAIFASCATSGKSISASNTPQGVEINFESTNGINVGDKISALKKDCTPDGKSVSCHLTTIGHLKVLSINGEKSLLAEPDKELKITDDVSFEKDNSLIRKRLTMFGN